MQSRLANPPPVVQETQQKRLQMHATPLKLKPSGEKQAETQFMMKELTW